MPTKTYARGLIFWVDDKFENQELPDNLWVKIFGDHSDRVFRLLDIYVEVAASYEQAINRIKSFDSYREAGTFLFCVIDLVIPARFGNLPEMKYGVALAKELRKRNIAFALLSSNTGSSNILDEERLSNVPYHVKEPGSEWRFPDSLILNVLSEIRRHISWISVEDIVEAMHENSDISASYRIARDAFRFFPFFGAYRDFVERCEYREIVDLASVIAVRSPKKHCDEFVQQALAIMLYPTLLRKLGQIQIKYGHAHDPIFIDLFNHVDIKENPDMIFVIRISPDLTSINQLKSIINLTSHTAGKIILVLPTDESVDEYIEYLRGLHIMAKEELPSTRLGDLAQREELIRHSCVLTFHLWSSRFIPGEPVRLDKGSLTFPELLINPINWAVLLETENVPEALSDPFEIVKELIYVLENMGGKQRSAIRQALENGQPVAYEQLLKVGREALLTSEFKDEIGAWVERALENWLKSSWQYPYGISNVTDGKSPPEQGVSPNNFEGWQDSCYEILVSIMNDYRNYQSSSVGVNIKQLRLKQVAQFIDTLGGVDFLNSKLEAVNWDDLALLRWPHRYYPMPSAVLRRLKEAGRYLWIQPEGLDIATTLPNGRQRYRMLSSIVDYYWNVLTWVGTIIDHLPLGWKWSIEYLTDIIINNQIATIWKNEPNTLWFALLGLLRNGGPLLYISQQMLRGRRLGSGKDNAKEFLGNIKGYGAILEKIRGSRKHHLGCTLIPTFGLSTTQPDIQKLTLIRDYLNIVSIQNNIDHINRIQEIEIAIEAIIRAIGEVGDNLGAKSKFDLAIAHNHAVSGVLADSNLNLLDGNGWFIDELIRKVKANGEYGEIPSLYGTKLDFLWKSLDAIVCLDSLTHNYRYYDGYHFLASLNDLRVKNKDTCPNVPLPMIESVMELFIASIEGMMAQLSWCIEILGEHDLAKQIKSPNVQVQPPEEFKPPSNQELSKVMRVNIIGDDWELYTLGIPGESTVNKLCYHSGENVKEWQE